MELSLKILVYVLCLLDVESESTRALVEMIPDLLDTNSTHTHTHTHTLTF